MKIYTIIPKAIGRMETWPEKIPHAFCETTDAWHLPPLSIPGASESYYSAYDPMKFNTDIADSLEQLIEFAQKHNKRIVSDLVYNHVNPTSKIATEHPDWIQKSNGEMKIAGEKSRQHWKDLVVLDYTKQEVRDYALKYAMLWGGASYQTNGIIRLDNLHESDETMTKEIIATLKKEYNDIHITGEYFSNDLTPNRQIFEDMGVDTFLSMQHFISDCPDISNYLRNMHAKKTKHLSTLGTHDEKPISKRFGNVDLTVPRYAMTALATDDNKHSMRMWSEYGHPKFISFIGKHKPISPIKTRDFESYFSAIDERSDEFCGNITIENDECVMHIQRNNHQAFINFDTYNARKYGPYLTLPPGGVLVDNTLFSIQNGTVVEKKY